ncbi:glycosyltransferase family A protein [Novosphingobium sp. FKTRR1]|uniref:glycosyltransferase family 2 protein n=1 Tax=Novosphingobium sp. FKTRR1 TaxID=2879118 RepID=UPI001CEFDE8A|nr:glycosyltransferase family A protein [Novosphingobium sp. FKTRR1]
MILPDFLPAGSPDAYVDIVPEISVIVPVYNAAATIGATIASVLDQTFRRFEIVAVDDGSSDESLAVLLGLAAQDSRIRVISQRNGGVSSARNLGAETAMAPLIAFLDSDDLWARDKLACHVALHRAAPELAASYARIAFIAPDADTLDGARTVSTLTRHAPALADLLGENPVCTASNLVVRRDWFAHIGGFDDRLNFAEDQEFVARLVSRGGKVDGIDSVLTGYRFSPDGLSMDHARMHAGWRVLVDRYIDDAAIRASLEALYSRYLARRVLRSGGSPVEALRFVLRGLRLDARSFMAERQRGLATVLAACAAPLIPAALRRRLFA